jgi:hypothetical protein
LGFGSARPDVESRIPRNQVVKSTVDRSANRQMALPFHA